MPRIQDAAFFAQNHARMAEAYLAVAMRHGSEKDMEEAMRLLLRAADMINDALAQNLTSPAQEAAE
jgi:hypothetical protein